MKWSLNTESQKRKNPKQCDIHVVVESAELEANDEQGTPIVNEDGSTTCNCVEPKQSSFPNGKWICLKCWGEWYH